MFQMLDDFHIRYVRYNSPTLLPSCITYTYQPYSPLTPDKARVIPVVKNYCEHILTYPTQQYMSSVIRTPSIW